MEGHDGPVEPDPDDWFSEPDVTVATGERTPAPAAPERQDVDDWLGDDAASSSRRRRRTRSTDPRLVVAVGLGLVIVLIIGLALAGVFGSSSSNSGNQPLFTITTGGTTTTTHTTTTTQTAAVPTKTLKPGDTGEQVKVLQEALNKLGYSVGKVDGAYGPATTQAVKNFQTAAGLTADGVCGPKTIAALESALQKS